MPRNRLLSERQAEALYTQVTNGESIADLAASYGISETTARKYIREMRRKKEGDSAMASRSKIVAGDKHNGRLVTTPDNHRFEGTCVVHGKRHSKSFTAPNAREAEEQWRKWCQSVEDEHAFMDMVERKQPEPEPEPEPEPVSEPEPAAVPVIEVKRWREVAEERAARIEELEAKMAELERTDSQPDTPSSPDKAIYVIWAKTSQPKLYGAYVHLGEALKKVDELNDVAAFLGNGSLFEVEEVGLR